MADIPSERLAIRSAIDECASSCEDWAAIDPARRAKICTLIERGCHNRNVEECSRDGIDCKYSDTKFQQRYSAICSRVISNLMPHGVVNSTYLLQQVIAGEVVFNRIAYMESEEMCPAAGKAVRDDLEKRKQQKPVVKFSTARQCNRCGARKTSVAEYCGGGLDEAMKLSIQCLVCEKTWRS